MVGIIDYGMGNLNSVLNAFEYVGEDVIIIDSENKFEECTHLVIPGVGTYAQAMQNLKDKDYIRYITKHVDEKKPILGICLGMQILSTIGTEPVLCDGLNLIEGSVDKFMIKERIPHMGWNNAVFNYEHPVFYNIRQDVDFYFVHSYIFHPKNIEDQLSTTTYGISFSSIIAKDNIIGIQFHPEKSQENGLKIIENFAQWDGKC